MTNNPDICPTCTKGRHDPKTGIVSLLERCCAVYFYGPAHGNAVWNEYVAHEPRIRQQIYLGASAVDSPSEEVKR